MAYDKSEPQDNTKLTLAPGVIRSNWAGIEAGELPFDFLHLAQRAVTPPVPGAGFGRLYTAPSGAATEAFYENSAGEVKQLTGISVTSAGTEYGFSTPWGVKFNMGYAVLSGGSKVILWKVPFTSVIFTVVCSKDDTVAKNQTVVSGKNLTQATFYGNGNEAFEYLAIGI